MEESLKYFLLGQQANQPLRQIFDLNPILSTEQIKQIRLPLEMRRFKVNLQVLHACIYYILGIQKSICCEGSAEFREKCLAKISNYYIKKKMNFEIYEYGYLSSRILSLPIQKVIHIIYYMVYSRLASRPYVNNLISHHQNKPRNKRKYTVKSDIEASLHSKSMDSRHFTVFMDTHQLEIDVFKKDLKRALNSTTQLKKTVKKNDNKRYFNLTKVYPEQEEHLTSSFFNNQENPPICDGLRKGISIPLKVGATDNSSIISRLKFTSSKTEQREGISYKKLQLRRQKFNEQFDCGKKYEALQKQQAKQLKKTGLGTKRIGQEESKIANGYKIQKHPFLYFSSMASTIKSNNKELDNIRSECTAHVFKKMALRQNDWNRQKKEAEFRFKIAQENDRYHTQPLEPEIQLENGKRFLDGRSLVDEQHKLQQKLRNGSFGGKSKEGQGEGVKDSITRKANLCGQDEKLLLFGKKMKNKFKVQKYKEQFRHFLKTQMFERVRSIL